MDAITAFWNIAHDYRNPQAGKGIEQLAIDLDRAPSTLNNELTRTGTAKLGWETGITLMQRTRDYRPLLVTAAELGFMCIQMPEAVNVSTDAVLKDLGLTCKEFADVAQAVSTRVGDGEVSDNDLKVIEKEWGELMAQGQVMLAHLRSMNLSKRECYLRKVGA